MSKHKAITAVLNRADNSKSESDFAYFFSLLVAGEAMAKTVIAGIIACIEDDADRNRYRLEHQLVRASGIGEWGASLEDAISGAASQFLVTEIRTCQAELIKQCKAGEWQYDAVQELRQVLDLLDIKGEDLPAKSDLRRWFRLFATLRNKTRGHGAMTAGRATELCPLLHSSLRRVTENCSVLKLPWAYLHRNLSGRYRVTPITELGDDNFAALKKKNEISVSNGVYIDAGRPRFVALLESDPDLKDFFCANGGLTSKKYELISYITDDKQDGDASKFQTAPGKLPASETEGPTELEARGNCFTNIPEQAKDYISRPTLEHDLKQLLLDDKRPIVTLVGRGGIGKTSSALRVLHEICESDRYSLIIWLSARDVDLQLSGPKPVRPTVSSPKDMSGLYASLVLSEGKLKEKGFNKKEYFESQLQDCEHGSCLFVFDNFETTQNPVDVFNWVDAHVRLPNKVLITTRLRDFKGDYPVDVHGMLEPEANQLIENTAFGLGVTKYIDDDYKKHLIQKSEGHPYVIKVLLGEVAKLKRKADIPRLVAGTEDILIALFERTYAALSPCAQRAFLTLSGWASPVPKLALEAVLYRSTEERSEVENGIESLLQYSMAELLTTTDGQEFLSLPLVTSSFGKRKLNIHPAKPSIQSDVEILQMLGPSRKEDKKLGLNPKIQRFMSSIARRIEDGASYEEFAPIIEAICLSYNPGWYLLGRWHVEQRTEECYKLACDELRRFLENDPDSEQAADAWKLLAIACFNIGDHLGEVHAFVERAHSQEIPFNDLSSTANKINRLNVSSEIDREHKRDLARRLLKLMEGRETEADADAFARMAWMALSLNDETKAKTLVSKGAILDDQNFYIGNLKSKLNLTSV